MLYRPADQFFFLQVIHGKNEMYEKYSASIHGLVGSLSPHCCSVLPAFPATWRVGLAPLCGSVGQHRE